MTSDNLTDPLVTQEDRLIDAALHAPVPGGSEVWVWLPQKDAWPPHETARDVMRAALAVARPIILEEALDCQPCTAEDPNETSYERGRFDGIMAFATAIRSLGASK